MEFHYEQKLVYTWKTGMGSEAQKGKGHKYKNERKTCKKNEDYSIAIHKKESYSHFPPKIVIRSKHHCDIENTSECLNYKQKDRNKMSLWKHGYWKS